MQRKIILILLFAVIVAVFAIQNSNQVSIKVFKWQIEVSLVFIVLGALVLGSLLMVLVTSIKQLRMRKEIRFLKKQNEKLEEMIDGLKSQNEELLVEKDDIKESDELKLQEEKEGIEHTELNKENKGKSKNESKNEVE